MFHQIRGPSTSRDVKDGWEADAILVLTCDLRCSHNKISNIMKLRRLHL